MIRAYHKVYLEKTRNNLGRMLDFATYDLGYDPCTFFNLFINSGLAKGFEKGEFHLTVGVSGVELAYRVLELTNHQIEDPQPRYTVDRSPEYWAGWALAYYQWETALSFLDILECVPLDDIIRMYSPYHEMDIRQFCDRMDELRREAQPRTNLQARRLAAGLSQSQLARAAGIPVRTLQQYEQRQKDVNHARADYLVALSRALCCEPSDLLECQAGPLVEYAVVSL
jgi:DNA-binding transcriptional regulator YiaG